MYKYRNKIGAEFVSLEKIFSRRHVSEALFLLGGILFEFLCVCR